MCLLCVCRCCLASHPIFCIFARLDPNRRIPLDSAPFPGLFTVSTDEQKSAIRLSEGLSGNLVSPQLHLAPLKYRHKPWYGARDFRTGTERFGTRPVSVGPAPLAEPCNWVFTRRLISRRPSYPMGHVASSRQAWTGDFLVFRRRHSGESGWTARLRAVGHSGVKHAAAHSR